MVQEDKSFDKRKSMNHMTPRSGAGVGVGMFMVVWFYGFMILWFFGFMVLWFYGFMVL